MQPNIQRYHRTQEYRSVGIVSCKSVPQQLPGKRIFLSRRKDIVVQPQENMGLEQFLAVKTLRKLFHPPGKLIQRDRRKFCVIDVPRQYENLRLSQE